MNKMIKKIMSFALVSAMTITAMTVATPAMSAEAAAKEVTAKEAITITKGTETLNLSDYVGAFTSMDKKATMYLEGFSDKAKVTISIADKSVATGKYDSRTKIVSITAKKIGSTKMTLTVKDQGKTYKGSCKMTWVKYSNPLKSLKYGSTSFKASYLNKNNLANFKSQSKAQKVNIKLNSGFKLTYIYFFDGDRLYEIKNGDKIKFQSSDKKSAALVVFYKDKKGNELYFVLAESNKTGAVK